jgi:hypothetical protein
MEEFKQRLINEDKELTEKTVKLAIFIHSEKFNAIDDVQQALLKAQHSAMVSYSTCLTERIKRL